jgi:3-oxoacyl-[acyl-carrier protein] reductase
VVGATSGIGRVVALQLASEGADVVATARRRELLDELEAEIVAAGGKCEVLEADAIASTTPELAIQSAVKQFGRLDGLVYCAGAARASDLDSLDERVWDYHMDLMLKAPVRFVRAALNELERSGDGRIVLVASTAARQPSGAIDYDIAKLGLISLTKTLSTDLANRRVIVNCICPGSTNTAMWMAPGAIADQLAKMLGTSREEVLEGVRSSIPLGRFADPAEIASVITFMVSPRNSYMTGSCVVVDGGATRGLP